MEYKIIEQISFDWVIAFYFFLGGLAAGSYFVSIAANYWKTELKKISFPSVIISLIVTAMGLLSLFLDLGKPLRFWRLLVHFNPTSALCYGALFLNVFFIIAIIYAIYCYLGKSDKIKKLAYLGLFFAILVATYTGVLLSQAPDRVLWHSPLLPVLFLTGGIISGTSFGVILGSIFLSKDEQKILTNFLGRIILFEILLIGIEIIVLMNGSAHATYAIKEVLFGQFKFHFWILEILAGLIIPFLIFANKKTIPALNVLASILVLIGMYSMRYIIVLGGHL